MAVSDFDRLQKCGNAVFAGSAIRAKAEFGNGFADHDHPFVAPAVRPPTNSRCIEKNRRAIGSVMTTEAAMTAPQSVLNSVENSASPIGRVFTEESVAKHSAKTNSFQVVTNA